MCRAPAETYVGFVGRGDAAHPASLPTSQTPSPRRPQPSPRTRDIPPYSEPGRSRRARNVPTKQTGSRRLTIWVFLGHPPILRPPAGAETRPAWCIPLASHGLAHHSLVDACARRSPRPYLPADGRMDSLLALSSSSRRSRVERGEVKLHRRTARAPAARARAHASC